MFDSWREKSAEGLVAEIERWFAVIETGHVLRAPNGNMLPIKSDEAAAIKAAAIGQATRISDGAVNRMASALVLVVLLVSGPYLVFGLIGFDVPAGYGHAVPIIMLVHGIWLGYEIFAMIRAISELRASIAFSLRGRVPLSESIARSARDTNAAVPILKAIGYLLIGYYVAAEIAAHFGWDMVGPVSGYVFLALVLIIPALALYSKRHDATRRRAEARLAFDHRIADQLRRLPNTGRDTTGRSRGGAAASPDALS